MRSHPSLLLGIPGTLGFFDAQFDNHCSSWSSVPVHGGDCLMNEKITKMDIHPLTFPSLPQLSPLTLSRGSPDPGLQTVQDVLSLSILTLSETWIRNR